MNPEQFSNEEMARMSAKRILTDAEAIKNGAGVSPEGKIAFTMGQKKVAHEEMRFAIKDPEAYKEGSEIISVCDEIKTLFQKQRFELADRDRLRKLSEKVRTWNFEKESDVLANELNSIADEIEALLKKEPLSNDTGIDTGTRVQMQDAKTTAEKIRAEINFEMAFYAQKLLEKDEGEEYREQE